MWQVVTQGNLLASSILFLGANFSFFIFSPKFSFLLCSCCCSLKLKHSSYLMQQFLIFLWLWKRSGYEIFSLIYTTMEVGNTRDFFFWEFKPRGGIRKNKSWE
jgi:hypothetical protein